MHTTHAFLVHVNENGPICTDELKLKAVQEIELHRDMYDYYMLLQNEADYPDGVLLGKLHPKKIVEVLKDCKREQYANASYHRSILGFDNESGLRAVLSFLKNGADNVDVGINCYNLEIWRLEKYIALISGEYCDESVFFDTETFSSFIDIEKVKANPAEWALVMFDLHV